MTTGISAPDRARTIMVAIDPDVQRRGPGRARATSSRCAREPGGVLERAGHTEAAVDLARLAGPEPGRR